MHMGTTATAPARSRSEAPCGRLSNVFAATGGPTGAATAGDVPRTSGGLSWLAGDPAAAEREFRASYELSEEIGETGYLSTTACFLAEALYAQGATRKLSPTRRTANVRRRRPTFYPRSSGAQSGRSCSPAEANQSLPRGSPTRRSRSPTRRTTSTTAAPPIWPSPKCCNLQGAE